MIHETVQVQVGDLLAQMSCNTSGIGWPLLVDVPLHPGWIQFAWVFVLLVNRLALSDSAKSIVKFGVKLKPDLCLV